MIATKTPRQTCAELKNGLVVRGRYFPGYSGSDVEPPEAEFFDVEMLIIDDTDVTEAIIEFVDLSEIETAAINAIRGIQ